MSAWLGGLGVGLYLGIVGTVLLMVKLERRRIREANARKIQENIDWCMHVLFSDQLTRATDRDAIDALVGPETYRGPDVA